MPTPYATIQRELPRLTQAEQVSLLIDLIQGNQCRRSDALIDALASVDTAFDAAFDTLADVADWHEQRVPAL